MVVGGALQVAGEGDEVARRDRPLRGEGLEERVAAGLNAPPGRVILGEVATLAELAGGYVGTPRLRAGAEDALKPAEVRALLREAQPSPLELRADGTFRHRGALEGLVSLDGDVLRFAPVSFDGMTHESMRERAEEAGREFGLGWIFDPFEIEIEADGTLATVSQGVVQVAYVRKGKK